MFPVALFFSGLMLAQVLSLPQAEARSKREKHSPAAHQAWFEDKRSEEFKRAILKPDFELNFAGSQALQCYLKDSCTTDFDLFLTVLSDLYSAGQVKKVDIENWLDWMTESENLSEADLIHYIWTFRDVLNEEWSRVFAELHTYSSSPAYPLNFVSPKIKYIIQEELQYFALVPADGTRVQMARDLLKEKISANSFKNGAYKTALRMYLLCRDDRRFPCLLVVRDSKGNLIRTGDGKIWSHQLLAYSRHLKKYNESSGNTPAGVYTVDGVMPSADRKADFGQWRRLIMNFIPASAQEATLKSLLPKSSHQANWWRETVVARDMGRNSFRVHGTQQPAPLGEPYFPFFGTSGCIANRENTYDGTTYKDQRTLLDSLMTQLKLSPVYANETKIQALLYVMSIDNAQKWVSLEDLKALGILQ
ncbi:MAG: hypothetical protein AABZ31_02015 [Bdellovibrionota bacterium]